MAIHDQISAARVTCGPSAATDLERVARAFGLSTAPDTYCEIDRAAAEVRMIDLLQYDLAYDTEIMPHVNAVNLAREFLDWCPVRAPIPTARGKTRCRPPARPSTAG